MEITVTGRKIEMTDSLRSHVEEKIKGIKKFLAEAQDVHIVLSVEKHRHFAEIILNANGYVIHCKEETDDMYSTIDRVLEKLGKQIKKHKNRIISLKNKKRSQANDTTDFRTDIFSYAEGISINEQPQVMKSKKFDSKPMFLEEASIHIQSTKNNFMVFRNAANGRINILYFRNDGNLGLIDT